jgi:hypothetical protein
MCRYVRPGWVLMGLEYDGLWRAAVCRLLSVNERVLIVGLSDQVDQYVRDFPYQETYKYAVEYTGGDPANLNKWVMGSDPVLIKAGEDKVVRTNNDTFYKAALVVLDQGPVTLRSDAPSDDRFSSFQLMDDRNVNYRNVIRPSGAYILFRGQRPESVEGEAIEVPSSFSVVLVRVEVKDKDDLADLSAAEAVFGGISIEGPDIASFPKLDLLSKYSDEVAEAANRKLDETLANEPFAETVVGPGKELGVDVPYLSHSAGTKGGWGGPGPEHSTYEFIFTDADGKTLVGANGTYQLTTTAPPVDAFWSITVYDTNRGGFLHPNKDDRYHINGTTAVPNDDESYTFNFKTACEPGDLNCLEVPEGRFDLASRYYLPKEEIVSGGWQIPRPRLQ